MIFDGIIKFVKGSVRVEVRGRRPEKFVNICVKRGFKLTDIKNAGSGLMSMRMGISDFRRVRQPAKKSRVRVVIARKLGLPFLLRRYRRRKVFAAGAAIFAAALIFLTSFIWDVRVLGVAQTDKRLIDAILSAHGVEAGRIKYGLDTNSAVSHILTTLDTVAWAELTIKGTVATLTVSERRIPPTVVDMDEPCDIVAAKDGYIVKIDVKNGLAKVKAGDTVVKGQLLVAGTVPVANQEGVTRPEHAIASLTTRTWYSAEAPVDNTSYVDTMTGNETKRLYLMLGSKKINLYNPSIPYKNYDKIIANKGPQPLKLIIETYYEKTAEQVVVSMEEAKDAAAAAAFDLIRLQIPQTARVVKSSLIFTEREEGAHAAELTVECYEDIAKTVPIGGK